MYRVKNRVVYELPVHNNVSYQTLSGFLVDYVSARQDIKFPRDVLKDKAGTCVDLAILFAAVCRAVDLKTYIVVVPGHAFPVVELPSGDLLPIESTGIGGPSSTPQPTPQRTVDLSGHFVGSYRNSVTGAQGKLEFYIEQSGNNIKSDVYVDDSDEGEFTGTISSNTMKITARTESFEYSTVYTVVFTGTVQGNMILGSYSVPGSNVTGTFSVRKSY